MAMSVLKLQKKPSEPNYYSGVFRNIIEDHLKMLINTANRATVRIPPINTVKYRGDFYGLLQYMEIPEEHHWITMRLNGLHCPTDYAGDFDSILVPDRNQLEILLRRNMNSQRFV
jgi:hypothetical protein